MIVTRSWLQQFVNITVSNRQLCNDLTALGLEVDSCKPVALAFDNNVVIAKIIDCQPHPDADRLQVCQVSIGDSNTDENTDENQNLQIVCGAPNAKPGLIVALARVGSVLNASGKPFKIKKSKIRGVASDGMLCSAEELGFVGCIDGIIELDATYQIGKTLLDTLVADDVVIELSLTPNRADCNSVLGIARELSCLYKQPLINIDSLLDYRQTSNKIVKPIQLLNSRDCSRFSAMVIEAISMQKQTPLAMQTKLLACGLRCHDPIVDITNFVMLELGQPLHAYDNNKLTNNIKVRNSQPDEELELLDGKTVKFVDATTLLVADGDKAISCAGIMGGQATAISDSTTEIMLEAAFFKADSVAKTARLMGYQTDASYRFARGVDPTLGDFAIKRVATLINSIVGGKVGAITDTKADDYPQVSAREQIVFNPQVIEDVLGLNLTAAKIKQILVSLNFKVTIKDANNWLCVAPSYRFDMHTEQDLVEEVARVYGYDKLPLDDLHINAKPQIASAYQNSTKHLQTKLQGMAMNEVISYSFIDSKLQEKFALNNFIKLINPLTNTQNSMRCSLLPGLINTALFNFNRQHHRLRLYEFGQCFNTQNNKDGSNADSSNITITNNLAILLVGDYQQQYPAQKQRSVDFFDIKGIVENLLINNKHKLSWQALNLSYAHPHQTTQISYDKQLIGKCGILHPQFAKDLGITTAVAFAEINIDKLPVATMTGIKPISQLPMVRRDITIDLKQSINYLQVVETITKSAGTILQNINVFDIYKGQQLAADEYSLSIALYFNNIEKTLTDVQVDKQIKIILNRLFRDFNASMR